MRLFSEPVFSIRALTKRRSGGGTTFELCVPDLTVHAGEVIVIKGSSGSGKSTLLDLLAMVLRPDSAEHFAFTPEKGPTADVNGFWLRKDSDSLGRLRGKHIGYVLQTGGLLSFLTARENISLSCRLLGRRDRHSVERLAGRLNIAAQLDKLPAQLSVGERQRVAIARALVHRPSVVLADEPTASVDPLNARAILELFLELVEQFRITTIIATHDWRPVRTANAVVLNPSTSQDGEVIRSVFRR